MAGKSEKFIKIKWEKLILPLQKSLARVVLLNQNIKKDKIIFIAKGVKKKDSYGPDYELGSYWMAIEKYKWINPPKNSPLYFTNHSCLPNAGLKGKITIIAMRNIKKGEEITLDYSTTEDDPYWKMKCFCGSKNCRKIIRSVRFLPPEFFKKYKTFIPKWLQKSYLQSHTLKKT